MLLDARHLPDVRAVIDAAPLSHVFVQSQLSAGLDALSLGGQLWGWCRDGELESIALAGANFVPVATGTEGAAVFAEKIAAPNRRCASIVGPKSQVQVLWDHVSRHGTQARLIRHVQPALALRHQLSPAMDSRVRKVTIDCLDSYVSASAHMFREEVGIDPLSRSFGGYRLRVEQQIRAGRSWGWFDGEGRTLFKVDVGARAGDTLQLQGVWLTPELRGKGLATDLLADALAQIQASIAPVITLYVNDFNRPARAVYEKLGFEQVDEFMTVFF